MLSAIETEGRDNNTFSLVIVIHQDRAYTYLHFVPMKWNCRSSHHISVSQSEVDRPLVS
jgi:hypothetical protein